MPEAVDRDTLRPAATDAQRVFRVRMVDLGRWTKQYHLVSRVVIFRRFLFWCWIVLYCSLYSVPMYVSAALPGLLLCKNANRLAGLGRVTRSCRGFFPSSRDRLISAIIFYTLCILYVTPFPILPGVDLINSPSVYSVYTLGYLLPDPTRRRP